MKITSNLFDAFLKCPTKCYLRSTGQTGAGNAYAEWIREQNDACQTETAKRLIEAVADTEGAVASPAAEDLKTATWGLAVNLPLERETMASRLHAVERVPSQGRGRPAQFIPIRFVFRNKLTKDDRLLLAFDALVLSQVLGRETSLGKIIHGHDHATLKVKVASLLGTVRKLTGKMSAMLAGGSPPDLILNRHCGECEFRDGCRQKALEKDDLSLLAGMSEKERQKLRSKGIFTVTQLSYTFRPRRRPKRLRDKRERYHHSLKALAIREKKIHIVGTPELKIDGTPVYLDVEGLPDRDFYYLIGVRIGNGESAVQHSLWADTTNDEGKIWRAFLGILETVEKPVLIHYGSYETTFLRRMCECYDSPHENTLAAKAIASAINLVSIMFAKIYFPTRSNGLKEIARSLGFNWSESNPSGAQTIIWRHHWEGSQDTHSKQSLVVYNFEDCQALERVERAIYALSLGAKQPVHAGEGNPEVVNADGLKPDYPYRFGNKTFAMPELEEINKAAYWDYQRERVYVRSGKRLKGKRTNCRPKSIRVNEVIVCPAPTNCPHCNRIATAKTATREKLLHDLKIGRSSVKRWVVKYVFHTYWCPKCELHFGLEERFRTKLKFGWNLVAYLLYHVIGLRIPQRTVTQSVNRLFGFELRGSTVNKFKMRAADFYSKTQQQILDRIVRGKLVHVDETRANIKGKLAYVWVLTNLREVAYIYAENREGEMIQGLLREFKGVLVSDFYAAYDSIQCPQQKCLIHLMRDLNADTLSNPFDEELKGMVRGFAELLRLIVQTVDRYGLKRHFLRKHSASVDRFYKKLIAPDYQSEAAIKYKQRFEKNREKLFTFLNHDGVPWNNNNAEHAIKAFSELREVIGGLTTVKGIEEYLVLLTICETCNYSGLDFLDFLRSGEKDIHAFAESRRGRRRRSPSNEGKALSADEAAQK
jgi:predicted RecB family nuclease